VKKTPLIYLTLAVALCGLGATGWRATAQTTQDEDLGSPRLRIGWPEFKKLYDDKKVVVIDVRASDSFVAGHIPGARSIPLDDIDHHVAELKKLKKPIVVYCA
jgi:3-mercaptopyruvate sulfurtransferase SseA